MGRRKLVVRGENRQQVLNRMLRALEEYHVLGIRTNIPYLRKILMHPEFISGDYDTGFIGRYQEELLQSEAERVKTEPVALAVAAILQFTRAHQQAPENGGAEPAKQSAWKIQGRIKGTGGRYK